ncbi:acetyl-CoA C-acetyltransferase [Alkalihalobacillus deserti]|uniref:acetyl-CoA C-acetyltransferase n=1 Tax=Alkalihalobacillus deserti TaxID=2879466 RepID=UPI001D142C9D|nr:acetyl-CoA C-acetyltransferase [Alkalihalobacillus deserti]
MKNNDVVVVEGARTPFGNFGGAFKDVSAIELGVCSAKEAISRSKIDVQDINEVVIGNVQQSSTDAVFVGRHIGLKSGLPKHVPGLTVNRLCGSGLEAITIAAKNILIGDTQVALAGGTENMSQIPFLLQGARWGTRLGEVPKVVDFLWEALYDPFGDCTMAITAENLAEKYELSKEEVDLFAKASNDRAIKAIESGRMAKEIAPVTVQTYKGEKVISQDEKPRKTELEDLLKLKPRFKENGVVTPGNASGINDGAATLVLASSQYAEKKGLKPLARLVSWSVVGVEPTLMGIGPVPAIKDALKKANLKLEDLDLIEINEAFAAQYLACQKELGFDPEIGNVNGGAVALGHPLGASGARISLSLIYELQLRNKRYGASAVCIGGGQGIAAIWERL